MAYVLGYIYADGCLIDCSYIRASYFTFTSIDQDSLQRIRKMMDSEHKITSNKSLYVNGKQIFKLKIGSNDMYEDLIALGLSPKKSFIITFPEVPEKYLRHFIRGYFDGDGCIYFEKGRNATGKMIIKRIRTIFISGSEKFLSGLNKVLAENDIKNGKIYAGHRSKQLVFNNNDTVELFKLMYGKAGIDTFFMRKFNTYREYFKARPERIDNEVYKILDCHK